jgi:phage portal protein BeeE
MPKLNDQRRRALQLLTRSPNGCTEALMLAHGFESAMLSDLVLNGLAVAVDHSTMAGRRRMKVTWLRITAAGRKAIAG